MGAVTVLEQENRTSLTGRSEAERPAWALRLREARQAQGWTQAQLVDQMCASAEGPLTDEQSLVRQIKRWESGSIRPRRFYRELLSQSLGQSCEVLFLPDEIGTGAGEAAVSNLAAAERLLAAQERAEVQREQARQARLRQKLDEAREQLAQIIAAATGGLAQLEHLDLTTETTRPTATSADGTDDSDNLQVQALDLKDNDEDDDSDGDGWV